MKFEMLLDRFYVNDKQFKLVTKNQNMDRSQIMSAAKGGGGSLETVDST